jgi:hypothetical protein
MKRTGGRPKVSLDIVAVRKYPEPARNQTTVVKLITCHFTEPFQLIVKVYLFISV